MFMTLHKLVDDISEEFNDKNHAVGFFIDQSKAFDTTDHKLLITKLFHYGVRGIVLD